MIHQYVEPSGKSSGLATAFLKIFFSSDIVNLGVKNNIPVNTLYSKSTSCAKRYSSSKSLDLKINSNIAAINENP